MRGFYIDLTGHRSRTVHELRDGDYPMCGAGSAAKQPIIRTEILKMNCPRCEKVIGVGPPQRYSPELPEED